MHVCCPPPAGGTPQRWAKTVHFVRHGEGEHNTATDEIGEVAYYCGRWLDADLTQAGQSQATEVGIALATAAAGCSVELACASPLTRTLHTVARIVDQLPRPPPPVLVHEKLRERLDGAQPANSRRSISDLRRVFPTIDFSGTSVDPDVDFALAQRRVYAEIDEPPNAVEEAMRPALRALLNYGFPRSQSQKALDAVAAAGDQTTQYRQVQLDLTEERTAAAAVSWLQTEKGLKPLFTEWEPLETEAETAGAKYCAAVFFHLCTAGAHERS